MNFDEALKHYWPQAWFRFKFLKYKYLARGEAELHLVRHLVEPGETAVDVGASIGMYSQELSLHARKVTAFEANPAVAAFAKSAAARNVSVINAALSSAAGRAVLKFPLNRKGEGVTEAGTIEPNNPIYSADVASIEVPVHRLDDLAIENCGFVKIDVEGHEEAVLDGGATLIAAQRPLVMVELNDAFSAGVVRRVTARFAALSYRGYFLSQERLRPVEDFDQARYQDTSLLRLPRRKFPLGREFISNFIFIPDEKRARVMKRLGPVAAA